MHEYSVGYEIVKTVLKNANEHRAISVTKIRIEIGELTLINIDQIKFWITELLKGTIAEKAKVTIKIIKPKVVCEKCGNKMNFLSFQCSECKGNQLRVLRGKECNVKSIEIN